MGSFTSRSHFFRQRVWIITGLTAIMATGSLVGYQTLTQKSVSSAKPAIAAPAVQAITSLGRLEPKGEVIQIAASTQGSRIEKLQVKQGDRVQAGQVIATLDTRPRLQAALDQAQRQVKIAQTKLAQVKAGAKVGEIDAQKAAIARINAQLQQDVAAREAIVARLEAEARNAQLEYQRYETLFREGAVSASLRDSKRLTLDAVTEQLREAQANRNQTNDTLIQQRREAVATLDRIAEVRPVDVAAAQAEVDSAIAAVQQAQAELNLAIIRAPRNGQILKIHTWAGEVAGQNGIVSLGQTNQMVAVAEVYESDIPKIKIGQPATITSDSIPGTFRGTVEEVGLEVAKKDVLNTDPAADIDARVVEVKVRLIPADSQKLAQFTNLKVKVAIAPEKTEIQNSKFKT